MPEFRSGRPDHLHYRARDGVYETHFAGDGGFFDFSQFVGKAVAWSGDVDYGSFALLDTFLSDSMNVELLERILLARRPAQPVKILLADPTSSFALARGGSIRQDTLNESIRGLQTVVSALEALTGEMTGMRLEFFRERRDRDPYDERIRCVREQTDAIRGFGDYIDLRFYTSAASGPLYFFRDIVLSGRFGAGSSAIKLPWSLIVKEPNYRDDLYGTLEAEFNHLWDLASGEIGFAQQEESRVFLSYAEADRVVAEELRSALGGADLEVFMAGHDITPSEAWMDALRVNLIQSSHVVMLLTPGAVERPWILAEAGAAWALGKPIVPVLAGLSVAHLPDVLAHRQAIDIAGEIGLQRVVHSIIRLIRSARLDGPASERRGGA